MDMIDQLAEAIAQHIPSPIPLSIDLWSSKEIAAYAQHQKRVLFYGDKKDRLLTDIEFLIANGELGVYQTLQECQPYMFAGTGC